MEFVDSNRLLTNEDLRKIGRRDTVVAEFSIEPGVEIWMRVIGGNKQKIGLIEPGGWRHVFDRKVLAQNNLPWIKFLGKIPPESDYRRSIDRNAK